jgi:hypothetical protein
MKPSGNTRVCGQCCKSAEPYQPKRHLDRSTGARRGRAVDLQQHSGVCASAGPEAAKLAGSVTARRRRGPRPAVRQAVSIAGAQEKTALLRIGNTWHRPLGATPTTHILKLPLGIVAGELQLDLSASVDYEWLCAALFEAMQLPVAHSDRHVRRSACARGRALRSSLAQHRRMKPNNSPFQDYRTISPLKEYLAFSPLKDYASDSPNQD